MIKENIMEKVGWVKKRNSKKLSEVRKNYQRLLMTGQREKTLPSGNYILLGFV